MTTISWWLFGALVYLVVGIILKNHTKIGTVQFKDYSTRFVIFWAIPLGGLFFYFLTNFAYCCVMIISEWFFGEGVGPDEFFPAPNWPKYPSK